VAIPMRASTRFLEVAYRLTGGRFGLMPGVIDLDGMALAFAVGIDIEPIGWECTLAHRIDGVRRIEIEPFDDTDGSDRALVIAAVTRVVRNGDRFTGPHILVFPDGKEVQVSGA